uniref:Putative tail protein n=1 Tax=viral metagenome TaxID=1070528 RepID=A0A6M3KIE2_9ZZZZ
MSDVLTELVAKITTDASGLKTGLSAADKSIGSFVTKNAAGLRSLGVAFVAMGTAIVGGLGASTKAAVDFETAFTGVRKTVDATEAEFATLRKGIRDLTKELPLTHTEIASIAEAAGQLGIKNENILGFTKVMAQLGMTTNLAAHEAAAELARFANITQMSQVDFDKLGSVIVDLGNNFATTEAEIVSMAMRLAGSGKTIGLTEPQIMGIATALSSVGIQAERGGTAFSMVMLQMNSAVAAGGDKLKAWADIAGVSTSEFGRMFREDASGALMTFIGGVGRLKDEGSDVATILGDIGLGGIRVVDSLLRASGAEDLFTDALVTANEAWGENLALTEEAANRLKDSAAKMVILKNVLVDVGITIGDFFIPLLKQFVDWMRPVINSIQTWINENPTLAKVLAITAGAVGLISLALGGLLLILPGIISLLGIFGVTLSAAIWPVTLVIAAIAALAAGGILLITNWDRVGHFFADILSNMKNAVLHFVDNALGYLQTFVGWLPVIGDKIEEAREKISNMIAMEKITRHLRDVQEALKDTDEILGNHVAAVGETTEAENKNAETIKKSTDAINEYTKAIDPGLIEAQEKELDVLKLYKEALEKQQDEYLGLLDKARAATKEFTYQRSEAGKLKITTDDVTDALIRQGWGNEELAKLWQQLGDDVNYADLYMKAAGLTIEEMTTLNDRLADSLDRTATGYRDVTAAAGGFGGALPPGISMPGLGDVGSMLRPGSEGMAGSLQTELGRIMGVIDAASSSAALDKALAQLLRFIEGNESFLTEAAYANLMLWWQTRQVSLEPMAAGGIVTQPTMAMIGEAGPEAVIPLNEMGSMGGITINFTQPVFFDREDTMNKFVDMISKGIDRKQRLRFGGAYNG